MSKIIVCRKNAVDRISHNLSLPNILSMWVKQCIGKWVVIQLIGSCPQTHSTSKYLASDGWDGSYHDAHYQPIVAASGRTPARARKSLRKLLALVRHTDQSQQRYQMRNLVREGD